MNGIQKGMVAICLLQNSKMYTGFRHFDVYARRRVYYTETEMHSNLYAFHPVKHAHASNMIKVADTDRLKVVQNLVNF